MYKLVYDPRYDLIKTTCYADLVIADPAYPTRLRPTWPVPEYRPYDPNVGAVVATTAVGTGSGYDKSVKRLGASSWRIGIGSSFFLNPPLFIREACGLSAPGDPWRGEPPWPSAFLADHLTPEERAAASQDWPAWWAAMLEFARAQATAAVETGDARRSDVRQGFDPPDFDSLREHPALRGACQVAWQPYIHWWQMPAGGSMALEGGFRLFHGSETINRVVRGFEARHRRRARPFSLHIDLVYPQTRDLQYVGEDFVVMGAGWMFPHNRFEDWLTERVEALG